MLFRRLLIERAFIQLGINALFLGRQGVMAAVSGG
jgi:hypothetical protein